MSKLAVITEEDIEELLIEARLHPCCDVRDELIDLGIDYSGSWIGVARANQLWHMMIPDKQAA